MSETTEQRIRGLLILVGKQQTRIEELLAALQHANSWLPISSEAYKRSQAAIKSAKEPL